VALAKPGHEKTAQNCKREETAIMATEIERKFLVRNDTWRGLGKGCHYRQGYLSTEPGRSVRVRVADGKGYLTIKGKTANVTRTEYEYAIPLQDADTMLDELCKRPLIEKTRYRIDYQGLVWEIDEFEGENAGLVIAEVELESVDQEIAFPAWIGQEVTTEPRYYNASLIANPFSRWCD
jgi:adenylate cyclase